MFIMFVKFPEATFIQGATSIPYSRVVEIIECTFRMGIFAFCFIDKTETFYWSDIRIARFISTKLLS